MAYCKHYTLALSFFGFLLFRNCYTFFCYDLDMEGVLQHFQLQKHVWMVFVWNGNASQLTHYLKNHVFVEAWWYK